MEKKIIRKKAKEKINSGKSKQQVYNELVEEFGNRIYVADLVRFMPEKKKIGLFFFVNYSFLLLLIASAIFMVKQSPALGESIIILLTWFIPLIVIVAMRWIKFYLLIAFFGSITFFTILVIAFYESFQELMLISLVVSVIYFLFGIYVPIWFTPSYQKTRQKYTNKEGQTRMRMIHKFN